MFCNAYSVQHMSAALVPMAAGAGAGGGGVGKVRSDVITDSD